MTWEWYFIKEYRKRLIGSSCVSDNHTTDSVFSSETSFWLGMFGLVLAGVFWFIFPQKTLVARYDTNWARSTAGFSRWSKQIGSREIVLKHGRVKESHRKMEEPRTIPRWMPHELVYNFQTMDKLQNVYISWLTRPRWYYQNGIIALVSKYFVALVFVHCPNLATHVSSGSWEEGEPWEEGLANWGENSLQHRVFGLQSPFLSLYVNVTNCNPWF